MPRPRVAKIILQSTASGNGLLRFSGVLRSSVTSDWQWLNSTHPSPRALKLGGGSHSSTGAAVTRPKPLAPSSTLPSLSLHLTKLSHLPCQTIFDPGG